MFPFQYQLHQPFAGPNGSRPAFEAVQRKSWQSRLYAPHTNTTVSASRLSPRFISISLIRHIIHSRVFGYPPVEIHVGLNADCCHCNPAPALIGIQSCIIPASAPMAVIWPLSSSLEPVSDGQAKACPHSLYAVVLARMGDSKIGGCACIHGRHKESNRNDCHRGARWSYRTSAKTRCEAEPGGASGCGK